MVVVLSVVAVVFLPELSPCFLQCYFLEPLLMLLSFRVPAVLVSLLCPLSVASLWSPCCSEANCGVASSDPFRWSALASKSSSLRSPVRFPLFLLIHGLILFAVYRQHHNFSNVTTNRKTGNRKKTAVNSHTFIVSRRTLPFLLFGLPDSWFLFVVALQSFS